MKNRIIAVLFAVLLSFSLCVPALANSPAPPDLAVFENDPIDWPDDWKPTTDDSSFLDRLVKEAVIIGAVVLVAVIVIEFIVLLLFGYRKGHTFLTVLIVSLITPVLFILIFSIAGSILMRVTDSFIPPLIIAAALKTSIEGLIYSSKFREHSKRRAWLYAIVSNIVILITAFIVKTINVYGYYK